MKIVQFTVPADQFDEVGDEPTIHDLFNELHRRLNKKAEHDDFPLAHDISNLASQIDALHHDYTELTQ